MCWKSPNSSGDYLDVTYRQFTKGPFVTILMRLAGMLTWPVTVPLSLISRSSDFIFQTCSELVAIVPYIFGIIVRSEFYRWSLRECGINITIGFGTVLYYRNIRIGSNVCIGNNNIIHHCDIGSFTLIGDGCQLLSGSRYHSYESRDTPIAYQGGRIRRIQIGYDTWIGSGSIVMNDIGTGSVVGAGSVVVNPVDRYSVVAGNPVRVIGRRGND